jgi:hypothetical protein
MECEVPHKQELDCQAKKYIYFWHALCFNINQTHAMNLTKTINFKKGGCKTR